MKTTLLALLLLASSLFAQDVLGPLDLPLPTGAVASAPSAPLPQVVVVQQPLTPEKFQSEAMGWIAAIGAILGAVTIVLVPALAVLWSKVHDIVKRQDRQAQKTGSLQEQVNATALQTTPPAPEAKPPTGTIVALILGALLLSGCVSTTPSGRATNQALTEAGHILGQAATSALLSVAEQEMTGERVDFGHAAAAGLWSQVNVVNTAGAINRIVTAYSAGKVPQTAAASQAIAGQALDAGQNPASVTNAVAAVISAAALSHTP